MSFLIHDVVQALKPLASELAPHHPSFPNRRRGRFTAPIADLSALPFHRKIKTHKCGTKTNKP
ncbi:MAG TPA: hypothetical protein VGN15_06550, partial [Ktedonobacteraceae bacterium]|nr:hypothetical protein [Ktedonobacteraceae bacterium]